MKKYLSAILILGCLVLVVSSASAADGYGAVSKYGTKAYGMGGAFSAIADDASAVYWNPAGLTQSSFVGLQTSGGGQMDRDEIEDIADFIDAVEEIDNQNLSDVEKIAELEKLKLPSNASANMNGMMAFNFKSFALAGVFDSQFDFAGSKETIYNSDLPYDLPQDSYELPKGDANNFLSGQGIVGWGTKVIDPPVLGSLSLGVSGKYLYARKDTAIASIDKDTGDVTAEYNEGEDDTGLGADIGALATLTDTDVLNVKAAATVKNVVNTMDMDVDSFDRRTTLGGGVTFKLPAIDAFSTRLAADLEMPEDGADITRLGFEGRLGVFSVRAGTYDSDDLEDAVYTGGVGFNLPFIDFNLTMDSEDYVSASGTLNF